MSKEELIRMKRKLETKVSIENAYSGSGPISIYELEQKVDTVGAINDIDEYFKQVITYFSSRGMKYDEITLRPLFSLIVKEKDLDRENILKPNTKPIPRYVSVAINGFYCMNGDQKITEDPDTVYLDNYNERIIVLEDFLVMLNERGFGFNGPTSVEDIQKDIMAGKLTLANITLKFKKNKEKVRV